MPIRAREPAPPAGRAHESAFRFFHVASTVAAATPLIYAALGETVVEKAGVLNLGIEGMMLVGAVAGFRRRLASGSATLGFRRGGGGRHCSCR